jgi:hypothetical protein
MFSEELRMELRGAYRTHDSWNLMRIIPTKGEKQWKSSCQSRAVTQ